MPAKLTLHPPQRASRFLVIRDGETLLVGRDPECSLVLEDAQVSKRHARLRWTGEGWALEDLGSKNGTSVNGAAAAGQILTGGDWLSFGGILGRFDGISETDARAVESERLARLHTSIELRRRLGADLEPVDLLQRFLESAVEVSRAERGFVLVAGPDGALLPEASAGFSPDEVKDERFKGSLGVLGQALETGASVVVQDAQADPVLGKRPSVVALGLGAVACVPLRHDERLLGLLYVDSRRPGAGFTALDLEILESLADHTAVLVAGLQLEGRIRRLARPARGDEDQALDELRRRIGDAARTPNAPAAPTGSVC
jgi:putative methionine-R-sulfoxide reductase with GAF domain